MSLTKTNSRAIRSAGLAVVLVTAFAASAAYAQGVRDHTRTDSARDATVSESQAIELTLTVIEAAHRPLQTWVRTAGTLDDTGHVLVASLASPEADLVKTGQRVRVFPPNSKSRMTQAKITRIVGEGARASVEATIPVKLGDSGARYVMEIIVDRGTFLAVSNEAIIEEGGRQVVYVEEHPGHYVPRDIHTGLKGELYAEVLHGLEAGDKVVTFGSFFIDAEYKLKQTGQDAMDNAHQHH